MRRFIFGEDPASANDYHGIVIHELPDITMDNETPMPLLRDIYAIRNTSFDKILDFHNDILFKKWPPFYMVFDYTNERTFTDMMIRDFGEDRVEKVNFTAGTSGTKLQLKQDGLSILKQGYQFPNPAKIRDPKKSELVRELVEELKHEEMKLTQSGRESFDHPTGRHNDLGIAWELSIHGCISLGLKVDLPGNYSVGQISEQPEINYAM
ncbi:MAG: hypothetical protein OEL69_09995 [Nitrosopumilus sp.]|nr:hypothetical protein [Nitrosopumilus sp.]